MKTCANCKHGWWIECERRTFLCDRFWAGDEREQAKYTVEVSERVAKEGCEECRNWKRQNEHRSSKQQKTLF